MADSAYADILSALDPLKTAGIDPDEARLDPKGAMARLGLGQPTGSQPPPWMQASNDVPSSPAPADNPLPPGLHRRTAAPQTAPQASTPATPAVPAGVTPSGNATAPDLAAGNAATIKMGQTNYSKASGDVDAEASQPSLADATQQLEQQRANYAIPTNPNAKDPNTGKPLYKPSFGQRLMRGVDGFARGGVFGAIDPSIVKSTPYSAPNDQYGYEEGQRQARVASVDQQLQQAAANWKAMNDKNKQVAADRTKLVTDLPAATNPAIAQQKIPIEQENADTAAGKNQLIPKTYEETVIAANQETDPAKKAALQAAADQMQKTELKKFAAQRPAGERPSAELQKYSDLKAAAVRDNGGKPLSAAQLATVAAQASGKGGGTTTMTRSQWNSLVNQHDREYANAQKAKDAEMKTAYAPAEKQAIEAKYAGIADELQDRWNQRYAESDPEGKFAGGGSPAPVQTASSAPASAAPAAPARKLPPPTPKSNPVGSPILVNGVQHAIVGYNPKTGKPIVDPTPYSVARAQ